MKNELLKNKINVIFLYIKVSLILFILFAFFFLILAYPKYSFSGILNGLNLCFEKVIASLFPMMIISSFILKSGLIKLISFPFQKIASYVFSLPKEAFSAFLISFIGGYPVGAQTVYELYENKTLSKEEAARLLLFCINPSISFTVNYIGAVLYANKKAGWLIYISIIISSFITGLILKLSSDKKIVKSNNIYNKAKLNKFSHAFCESITQSTKQIISICGTVTTFSCILAILDFVISSEKIKAVVFCLLEVTNGADCYVNKMPFYIICFAVSFGGICVHLQVMPYILKLKIKYGYFIFIKALSSLISMIISVILFYIFPCDIVVYKTMQNSFQISENKTLVSFCLLFMALIIIVTDNKFYSKKIKE